MELGYGRFMQTDPLGYDDGLNWYAYAGNDPVNGSDPSGMLEVTPGHFGGGGGGGSLPTFTGSLIPGVIANGLQVNGIDANAVQLAAYGMLADLGRDLSPSSASQGGPVARSPDTQPRDPVNFNPLDANDRATARAILSDSSIRSDIVTSWSASMLTGREYDFKIYRNGNDYVSRYGGSGTSTHGSSPSYTRVIYENSRPLFL